MHSIRIALAQICPETGNIEKNKTKIVEYMEKASENKAGLIVFPECSLTGYAPERAKETALSPEDEAVRDIETEADRLGIAVCFGFAEKGPLKPYISQEYYFSGQRTLYRKTHVAPREEAFFDEGEDYPLAELGSIKIGIQICWESHMPRISELYRSKGAQLLLFPYASGMSGEKCIENWSIHLPARASDNGCYAAACNLLSKGKGGGLAIWNPKGKLIAEYKGFDEEMIVLDLSGELPREVYERGEENMHTLSYFDHAKDVYQK